jgi:hypothetical protein
MLFIHPEAAPLKSCEIIFESGSIVQRIGLLETCPRPCIMACYANLRAIQIPSSVEYIDDYCFRYTCSLCEVFFEPKSKLRRLGNSSFFGTSIATICIPRSVERIDDSCFWFCRELREVIFEPESNLREIGGSAFKASGLKTIEIPPNVVRLGKSCFAGCESLRKVTSGSSGSAESNLPNSGSLKLLEVSTFDGTDLTSIHIPASIELIDNECFQTCRSLSIVTFEGGSRLKAIGYEAFGRSGIAAVTIPASVEVLCQSCFSGCRFLREVRFERGSQLVIMRSERRFWKEFLFLRVFKC